MLSTSTSYVAAIQLLKSKALIAPVYYTTAGSGPSEGMVITRDRNHCEDTWLLDYHKGNQTQDNWYLLETNYVSAGWIAKELCGREVQGMGRLECKAI